MNLADLNGYGCGEERRGSRPGPLAMTSTLSAELFATAKNELIPFCSQKFFQNKIIDGH